MFLMLQGPSTRVWQERRNVAGSFASSLFSAACTQCVHGIQGVSRSFHDCGENGSGSKGEHGREKITREGKRKVGKIARAHLTVRPETLPLMTSTLQVPHWPPPLQLNSLPAKIAVHASVSLVAFSPTLRLLGLAQGSGDPVPDQTQDLWGESGLGNAPFMV